MRKIEYQSSLSCDNCGHDGFKILHKFKSDYYLSDYFNKYSFDGNLDLPLTLVRCVRCSVVRQNPVFKGEFLERLYASYGNLSFTQRDLGKAESKFAFTVKMIKAHCPEKHNILDLGARDGAFMYIMQQKGYNAFGVEMNSDLVSRYNELKLSGMFKGNIENYRDLASLYRKAQAQIIHMNDVLEHMIRPYELLRNIAKIQNEGDYLILNQMNIKSPGYKIFKKHWYFIHAQHIYYFDSHQLETFLKTLDYSLVIKHEIPLIKSLSLIPGEFKKLVKDYFSRFKATYFSSSQEKQWYAANRPKLFDYSFSIYKKT